MKKDYIYDAYVVRIIDGDTIVIDINLGFTITTEQVLRMAGINAPEVHGATKEAGLAAAAWLAQKLPLGCAISVKTIKPNDKYGRYLAVVTRTDEVESVNAQMITAGHAVPMSMK